MTPQLAGRWVAYVCVHVCEDVPLEAVRVRVGVEDSGTARTSKVAVGLWGIEEREKTYQVRVLSILTRPPGT